MTPARRDALRVRRPKVLAETTPFPRDCPASVPLSTTSPALARAFTCDSGLYRSCRATSAVENLSANDPRTARTAPSTTPATPPLLHGSGSSEPATSASGDASVLERSAGAATDAACALLPTAVACASKPSAASMDRSASLRARAVRGAIHDSTELSATSARPGSARDAVAGAPGTEFGLAAAPRISLLIRVAPLCTAAARSISACLVRPENVASHPSDPVALACARSAGSTLGSRVCAGRASTRHAPCDVDRMSPARCADAVPSCCGRAASSQRCRRWSARLRRTRAPGRGRLGTPGRARLGRVAGQGSPPPPSPDLSGAAGPG